MSYCAIRLKYQVMTHCIDVLVVGGEAADLAAAYSAARVGFN